MSRAVYWQVFWAYLSVDRLKLIVLLGDEGGAILAFLLEGLGVEEAAAGTCKFLPISNSFSLPVYYCYVIICMQV